MVGGPPASERYEHSSSAKPPPNPRVKLQELRGHRRALGGGDPTASSAGQSEVSCLGGVGRANFSQGLHGDHLDATDPHVDGPLISTRSAKVM